MGIPIWYVASPGRPTDPGTEQLRGYAGDRCPDGAILNLADVDIADLAAADLLLTVTYVADRQQVTRIEVTDQAAPGAPGLWYVVQPEPSAVPPAINLVAFGSGRVNNGRRPDGTVVDLVDFAALGIPSAAQVAALRWWPGTGQIHQIYVAPRRRRERVGTKLVYAAAGYRAAHGWPALRSDGARTDLGEAWLAVAPAPWRHRIGVRTESAPPMTPVADLHRQV